MHLEFFNQPGNLTRDHVMFKKDGEYRLLKELDEPTSRILFLRLLEDDEASFRLRALKRFGITEPKAQLRQFISCNFGMLDKIDDLDEEGRLNYEFVPCTKRNRGCPFNSEICAQILNFNENEQTAII